MIRVLITGMSGTGKSTVIAELARLGHRAIDTDGDDAWTAWDGDDQVWREDRVGELLGEHESTGVPLFVSGTVLNQGRFYPRFTHVVLFTAPLDVMLARVKERTTNQYGKTEAEKAEIIRYTETVEPLLRAGADIVLDTRAPLGEVVGRVLALLPGGELSTGCPQVFPQKPGELSTGPGRGRRGSRPASRCPPTRPRGRHRTRRGRSAAARAATGPHGTPAARAPTSARCTRSARRR